MGTIASIFGWHGRIGILEWWAMILFAGVVWACYFNFIGIPPEEFFHTATKGFPQQKLALLRMFAEPPKTTPFWSVGISLFAAWIIMVAGIKRYHDLNMTGITLMFRILSVIGIFIVVIRCGFTMGSEEENGYERVVRKGNDAPKKDSGPRGAVSSTRTELALKTKSSSLPPRQDLPVAALASQRSMAQGGFGRRTR